MSVDVPATLTFDHPTIRTIATHAACHAEKVHIVQPSKYQSRTYIPSVAVCATSFHIPGRLQTSDSLKTFVVSGHVADRRVPVSRWRIKSVSNTSGGYGGFTLFSFDNCGLSRVEASVVDPQ